jgi:hypothetical protein
LSDPSSGVARRWTVIASGLLLLALALVVIFTRRNAFLSPLALVVVAAIGFAALLLQVRFRSDLPDVQSPFWLSILGLAFATASLVADYLHVKNQALSLIAFGAVFSFGISGVVILQALRRRRVTHTPRPDSQR